MYHCYKMNNIEEEYLKLIIGDDIDKFKKSAQSDNPLENSMWSNMIDGGIKALEAVAILSLDWKLTGIVKLLQSWLKDKREDKRIKDTERQFGSGYDDDKSNLNQDPFGGTYY